MRNALKHKKLILGLVLSHLFIFLFGVIPTYFLIRNYYFAILDEKSIAETQSRVLFQKAQAVTNTCGDMLGITEKMWVARNENQIDDVNKEYANLNLKKEEIKKYKKEMDLLLDERKNYPFKYFKISY